MRNENPRRSQTNGPEVRRSKLTSKQMEVNDWKAEVLRLYEQGHTIGDACRITGKSKTLWDYHRKQDKDFKERGDLITARRLGRKDTGKNRDISFEDFSEKYLHSKVFRHQYQWIDLIEGRAPRDLHKGQTYVAGDPGLIIINTPPSHAKSTTITMNYVTYKIVTNPNFRVVIISKTEGMAKKFLTGIKRRLTNTKFKELIVDFAPPEGFEGAAEMWSSKMIYFGHSESDQKDPNVEALGVGQQIYGARADLIILDDIEDTHNAHDWPKHLDYIRQDVATRDARLLVVGTRVAPQDIYTELLNPEHYEAEEGSPWTYLSQPAVLEYAEKLDDWVTLWPKSDQPHLGDQHPVADADGLYDKWNGTRLNRLRKTVGPVKWAMVYQQEPVHENSIFTTEAFNGCMSDRTRGRLVDLRGSYVIAGLDPATSSGYTACVVFQVDRRTGKRYLIDVHNEQLRAQGLRKLIYDFTEKYHINEWRIEKNAFQAFLTQDREINQFLAVRGVRLKDHHTGPQNKNDYEWGVSSLEALFRGWQDNEAILDIPKLGHNEAMRQLREQLITWYPGHPKHQKIDLVMALWFTELGARDAVKNSGRPFIGHLDNQFLSELDLMNRIVINIDDAVEARGRDVR